MFTYFQQKEKKGKWQYVVESQESLEELKENKAALVSLLSIKEPIDDEEDKHGGSYKGPLYLDIDLEGNPQGCIESAQTMANKLREGYGVEVFKVYLSGKKGFHFVIPMATFASDRPVKSLPLIYKEMALELYVEGIDLSIYNEGRPRLIRAPNVKRKDSGTYKVEISIDELYHLNVDRYQNLVKEPRPELPWKTVSRSRKLEALYETCKIRMQKKVKALENLEFVPNGELKKTVGKDGKLPRCIQILIEEGDTKDGSNFNQAAIQFAAYMVRAEVTDWKKHARAMAANVKSSTYNSEMARYQELQKVVRYVAGSKNYRFSKAMLFSVMEPCRDCVICNGTIEDGRPLDAGHPDETEIIEQPNGYYIGYGKQQRRLTTFTLEMISKFIDIPEDEGESETRMGTNAVIKVNGHKRDKVTILENAWESTRDFKKAIMGKVNYAFYGTDLDLQKMKHMLFSDEADMAEIVYVHSIGIHRYRIGGKTVLVYVEPGFSVSTTHEKNTHQVWGSIPAPPNIQEAAYPEPSDDLKSLIDSLLACNDPEVTSTLLGWMALCHIKVQLTMRENQFPVLNLWGNAGSGKSAISALFAYLHGVDYMLEHSPMSLQGTTPWAVAQYCTTSQSVPRLVEEFNRGEIPMAKYDQFSGMFKAAWNKQTFAKGAVENSVAGGKRVSGAKVVEAQISAPLCVMSEQAPERPALRQRMIQLNVRKSGRDSEEREREFYNVIDNKDQLSGLARAMVWQSLSTHPEWVVETMEKYKPLIPREIDARPQFSYQALLTGVDFFAETLKSIGLEEQYISEKAEFMRTAILNKLTGTIDEVRIEKSMTEVVLVLRDMAVMADSFKAGLPYTLEPQRQYVKEDDILYLDPLPAHTMYTRWARQGGEKVIISSFQQFSALIKQEEFFMGNSVHPLIDRGMRDLIKLDCNLMKERGISVTMFEDVNDG